MSKLGASAVVVLATVLVGAVVFWLDPIPVQVLRNAAFDQFQRWHPRVYEAAAVRVVDIDDESLRRLGQWPWPRTQIATLVDKLRGQGALVVGFDVVFSEPDRTSPRSVAAIWNPSADLRKRLEEMPDHDQIMAQALGKVPVVLGYFEAERNAASRMPAMPFKVSEARGSSLPYLRKIEAAAPSLSVLEDAARGNGALLFLPDADGVVRRVPLMLELSGKQMPTLAAELLRVKRGERDYAIKVAAESGAGIESIRIGSQEVPVTPGGEMWIHYTPQTSERYVPAWKLFEGDSEAARIRGHVVLVGTSAQGLRDQRSSPLHPIMSGVEAHAQALEQLLLKKYLVRPISAKVIEAGVIVLGGLLIGLIALFTRALVSASVTVLTLAAMGGGAWVAFTQYGRLLDPVTPGIALLLAFIAGSLMHHFASEREQRWVRQAFSRYVSPNRVDFLVDNPEHLELGGRRQECSFVFTDLEGFTTLLEKMDPGDAVALLNAYLDKMISIAFHHGGTLDRIVGDAVVVMFSAPVPQADYQQRALDCALEMHAFASQYSADLKSKGTAFGKTRIGVHCGEVIVGNFGGSNMFDYRALGDPINTAARLESVNKHLGTTVCVSEAILSGCKPVPVRPVARLVLKGKAKALTVFEPLATSRMPASMQDAEYEGAYALLREQSPDALAEFEQLAGARPDDPLVHLHLARLRAGEQGDLIVMDAK